jgi:hypothetical protein
MGRTLLGPNHQSVGVQAAQFIKFFMDVRFSAGTVSAFTWLSFFLQLLKDYFWRNHLGHILLLSFHFGHLSVCLLAK